MAFVRLQWPPTVRRGEDFEVRVSIRHPMETGYRVDDSGTPYRRNAIREVACRYNGTVVFRARTNTGVAANPYLRFFVTAVASGEIVVEWIDDAGERGDARGPVNVAP